MKMNAPGNHAEAVRKRWWGLLAASVVVAVAGITVMGWVPPTLPYHLAILAGMMAVYWTAAWFIWRCPACGHLLSPWSARWNNWAAECPSCGAKLRN
jgi:hypothetical protein